MAAIVVSFSIGLAMAQPVSTTFTYQGKLMNGASPASGTYDFQFKLFDAASGGNQVGSTNCYDSVAVTDGLVTLSPSFGNAFSSGTERYLEVSLRADTTSGNCASGVYTTLSPRQDVTGAPLAIGLRLPFSGTVSSSSDLVTLSNTGTGAAITASSNATRVVAGYSVGTGGIGVYGENNTYASYGGVGYGNWGAYGHSPLSYGVIGDSAGPSGAGVAGTNFSTSGLALGGTFDTASPDGVGCFGRASSAAGTGVAVEGLSFSVDGTGVLGVGDSLTGLAYGVYGQSNSSTGTGVYGYAAASSGVTYGVYGTTNSTSGYAGYFVGRSYFSDNVGINVLSPSVPLQVAGGADLTLSGGGNIIVGQVGSANLVMDNNEIQARSNGAAASLFINANGGFVGINTNNAMGFQLAVNGSAAKPGGGSWSSLSDVRLKKNVRPLTGSLDKLLELRGVTFEYIDPTSINELAGTRTGMIAQEVEQVFPDWVDQGPDGMRRLTFRGFEALTVEALRDLKAHDDAQAAALKAEADRRLAEKDAQITELRSRLDRLEAAVSKLTDAQSPVASSSH
jgi:hypothetical protein